MKKLLSEIITAWWSEVDTKLVNPKSEEAIKGLKLVLREDFGFDSDVIDYVVEMVRSTPTNFHLGGKTSGIDVGKNQTAVSAQLHPVWDDDEEEDDEDDVYNNNDGELSEWDVTLLDGLDELNEADQFTAIKNDTKNRTVFRSQQAKDAAIKAGTHSDVDSDTEDTPTDGTGEEESGEEETQQQQPDSGKPEFSDSDKDDMMTQLEKDKKKEKQAAKKSDSKKSKPEPQANGYVGDKDKSLKQGDPRESDVYQQELPPNDKEFAEKNKKFANPIPPEPYKMPDFLNDNPKFPKKYVKALERMMNTQPKGDATKWGHFSDIEGGAGQISAQAGELMTMMGSTMSDDEWNEFSNSILKHDDDFNKANPKLKDSKHKIVDKTWVKAATQSRKAIKDRLTAQYGEGVEIVAGAWDTQSDAEAMGMNNYSENKGFSTDMYLKIRKPNGEEVLDEVSLKKSTKVNFLNSGAGEFAKWDKNLPDEINQNVYREKARARNISVVNENRAEIEKLLKSTEGAALNAMLKSKKMTLDEALQGNSRAKQKVLWTAINELAQRGNKSAQSVVDADKKAHEKFAADSVKAITENPKMKEGMLNTIKNEFPLKAVSDGEETMAIGPNSLDKKTMKEIFGTDDYSKLKENLVAEDGPPPFIGYKIESSGEIFAIADIVIREDGRGYGGQFKFEMQLNQKSFAKRLEQAQKSVYGE
jgi:hypothetical protein